MNSIILQVDEKVKQSPTYDDLDFTLDNIGELNPDPGNDTDKFFSIIHPAGYHRFTQDLAADWPKSYWSHTDEALRMPPATGKEQIFVSINPICQRITDADLANPKFTGKGLSWIAERVASKNRTVAAITTLLRDYDAKDFTDPTPLEIEAAYQALRAEPKNAQSPEKALRNQAFGNAKSAKFKTDPAHYKALALAHVKALTPAPSVIVASGGGYNCYWLLDEPLHIRTTEHDPNNHITSYAADIQKRWVHMDAHADQGVNDIRRIFRPVGTKNHKAAYAPNFPVVSFVKKDFALRYKLAELAKILPVVAATVVTIHTARTTAPSLAQPSTYEGDSVIYAYNAAHRITDVLLANGYTQHGERMMRPGGDSKPGVYFNEAEHPNQSYHHSGNDPLTNGYWRTPFDVFKEWEHGGNLNRAVAAAAVELDMVKPPTDVTPIIDTLRLWVKTSNPAARLVGPGSKKLRLVIDAILDVMQANSRLSITAGKKRLAALAGVSPNTVKNVLALVSGKLFAVTPAEYGDQITLLSNCRLQEFDPFLDIVNCLTIGGQKTENDTNKYSLHKADDAFGSGISGYMKDKIKENARKKDITYLEAKEQYDRGLGEGVLLAFDTSQRIGNMTAQEYAAETGLKLSSARAHLRRCEVMSLASAEREGSHGPKVYTFEPDFWQRIEAMTPRLRTFKKTNQREDKRIKGNQQWTKAELEKAEESGDLEQVTKLTLRFERQVEERVSHLASLNPELSRKEIIRIARDVEAYKRSPQKEAAVKATRNTQRDEHRETVRLIADLVAETIDAGVTKEDVLVTVCKYGFDELLVRSVLGNQRLVEHAARSVGAETLARNIAGYKTEGVSKSTATKELEFAGFMPGEIDHAWAMVTV